MARDREGRLERLVEGKTKAPQWTETFGQDSPRMEVLRKSEDENPIINAAREQAAKSAVRGE